MEILTFFTPAEALASEHQSDCLVVFDVMGLTSAMVAAFDSGAKRILPVPDSGEALRLAKILGQEEAILIGECSGKEIDGFHFGFFPDDIGQYWLGDKETIIYSDNLAELLQVQSEMPPVYFACFNNIGVLSEKLSGKNIVTLLCLGNTGRFSIVDGVCAGMLIERLVGGDDDKGLNDSSVTSRYLYKRNSSNIHGLLVQSERGRILMRAGRQNDLRRLASVDSSTMVPALTADRTFIVRFPQ